MFKILRNTEKAVLKVSRVLTVNNLASRGRAASHLVSTELANGQVLSR